MTPAPFTKPRWRSAGVGVLLSCVIAVLPIVASSGEDHRQTLATYRSFAAAQDAMLETLKANLAEKRLLEKKYAALDKEKANKDAEIEEANAFCKGTFEAAEYRRRMKICREKERKLNAFLAAIDKVRAKLNDQDKKRRTRAIQLKKDYDALVVRTKSLEEDMAKSPAFGAAMKRCGTLKAVKERSICLAENWVPPKPDKAARLLDALAAGKGDWNRSITDLETRLVADPNDPALRDALSYLKGLYDGHLALSTLQNVRYKRGVLAWMEGDYRDAALHFAESYELDPTDKGALGAFGFVSGLDQARTNNSMLAPCHLISDCDPIAYSRQFAIRGTSPTAYRLLSEDQRKQLQALRLAVEREPENLVNRAALNYADGLSAWDDFRDRVKDDGQKIYNMPEMVKGITEMGRGNHQKALAAFVRGLDENWGEDGLTFSYFHAMGLNEGARATPNHTPRIWDERTSKIHADFYRDELRALQTQTGAGPTPPWIYAKRKLRREETDAWSRFLSDPLEAK